MQPRLRELREAIRSVAPEASESITYGVPTYKLGKVRLIYFGAAKTHLAVYAAATAGFEEELKPYKLSKGTIRFPLNKPLPSDLVRRLTAATVAERAPS